ncbi:hypothetical protein LY474_28845 [Myxococcus stipitatus]|uniref:hypothetical protein n=1 Tax=Myxococcus stipitatus TaxID=83455 RepID=UPI001F38513B|nr:hypothetical protein [Myxococcus stipitatus]MCE9671821.1 hypothetical protein [Myxococcus stipitatus]
MSWRSLVLLGAPLTGCSDDDEGRSDGGPQTGMRGRMEEATPAPEDAGVDGGVPEDAGVDAGNPEGDGGVAEDGGSPDAGPLSDVAGACHASVGCWDSPRPTGEALEAVWRSDAKAT